MDGRSAACVVILCLQVATGACSPRVVTTPGEALPPETATPAQPATGECALVADPGEPVATVGLSERVSPANAPYPSNESERLLFRQLYETLVRVDCHGRVARGLASSWRLDPQGGAWIVTLRENARFSDGMQVTAADVRAAWTRAGTREELRPRVSRLVESVDLLDDRTLAVRLRRNRDEAPLTLAHTDLAVARPAADSPWPLGTRSTRVAAAAAPDDVTPAVIVLEREDLPPVRFLAGPRDPRDLLDQGVDLLLTRDPPALDYAGTLSAFQSAPLAWQRTRVLLVPAGTRTPPALSDAMRQALADDAVRGEARGALGPFWWQAQPECEVDRTPVRSQPAHTRRIVYDAHDEAARDVAERLVGLAAYERAAGLTGEALAAARRLGTDAGYIASLDSRPVDPCRELRALMERAPWLDPGTIVPLVDTRLQAIVRRGRSQITEEWDGGLLLAPVDGPGQR